MPVDTHSNEIRYTCGLLAYLATHDHPSRVRIASRSIDLAASVARYLCPSAASIVVETAVVQTALAESLGLATELHEPTGAPADVALFPFSLEEGTRPAGEPVVVVACHNSLSYRTLLHPTTAGRTVFGTLAALKPRYEIEVAAGLFSPPFIARLALAKALGKIDSALFFRFEDRAMSRFVDHSGWWRLSYVVVSRARVAR